MDPYFFFFFLMENTIPLYGYTTFYLSITLANGHLGCFHILAVMNNAAVNPCEPMSLVLLGVYLGVELLGCMRTLCITF